MFLNNNHEDILKIAIAFFIVMISVGALFLTNKKNTVDSAQISCLKMLEQAATDARNETSEKHAQIMFAAMAKPECKAFNRSQN